MLVIFTWMMKTNTIKVDQITLILSLIHSEMIITLQLVDLEMMNLDNSRVVKIFMMLKMLRKMILLNNKNNLEPRNNKKFHNSTILIIGKLRQLMILTN